MRRRRSAALQGAAWRSRAATRAGLLIGNHAISLTGGGAAMRLVAEMGVNSQVGAAEYVAFISYSHADSKWAAWLHRAIESYHVPRQFVGQSSPLGKIPRRLAPVFRDRDELPSSSNLGAALE